MQSMSTYICYYSDLLAHKQAKQKEKKLIDRIFFAENLLVEE